MLNLPNTSALPALRAAVDTFQRAQRLGDSSTARVQTLYTFGGCTYTLIFKTADVLAELPLPADLILSEGGGVREVTCSSSGRSMTGEVRANAVLSEEDRDELTMEHSSEEAAHCPATLHIAFAHAIPFDQLNRFQTCCDELSQQLRRVASNCTVTSIPAPSSESRCKIGSASLELVIPREAKPAERDAALRWVAELRVTCLLPVLDGLLRRSQAAGEHQTLALFSNPAAIEDNADGAPFFSSGVAHSPHSISDARLTQMLIISATPLPASSYAPSSSAVPKTGAMLPFEGTVALTTCLSTRHAREAALIRSYLDAFSQTTSGASVQLLVQESPQPPPQLTLPAMFDAALSSADPPPYVWWCTMIVGPNYVRQAGALQRAVDQCLRLRPTVLFHVHQENTSQRAFLQQRLASYAARVVSE
ncbi:putative ARP2/3 complex subunit [Leptomonas seymouri]|uniref:Putative ARP2/3 complex subunit n=1 Tax=Leptomonas seymouri TaxID=5684 RepID=A0A0N0P323_LEPSE|nr:putative ARP2/3 complex subunit [Leptomonas seymouri]|eukprot:KPI83157.1 putative ARP2/3 complex subunit [Leptomonas seymouri]